jgi:F420-dependent oxidoreductase-like protein
MAQQALTTAVACAGRFTLGIGPSHHWIITDQLGLPYDKPASLVRDYIDVLAAAFAGPGPVTVNNNSFRVNGSIDVTDDVGVEVLVAALGPAMLRIAGERTGGTILWMADERAIGDYVVPRITDAATAAGRSGIRVVAGIPVALCSNSEADRAREYASEVLGHADFSPNYVRLLEHGDAEDVGDTMAAGDESTVLARLQSYRDAGVTDLAVRVVPLGHDARERSESRRRTQAFVASLVPEFSSGV